MRAQSSTEFLISLIVLLIIMVSMYELSASMSLRKDLFASQLEGEKTAAKVANAISWAMISGANSSTVFTVYSYPEQTLIVAGAQVLSFGPSNRTLAIMPIIANTSSRQRQIYTNQTLRVDYNGTNATIVQLG